MTTITERWQLHYSLYLLSYPGFSMLNVQFISRAMDGGLEHTETE